MKSNDLGKNTRPPCKQLALEQKLAETAPQRQIEGIYPQLTKEQWHQLKLDLGYKRNQRVAKQIKMCFKIKEWKIKHFFSELEKQSKPFDELDEFSLNPEIE